MRNRVVVVHLIIILSVVSLSPFAWAEDESNIPATHILDLNDSDALIVLKAMALVGDNHAKLLAEAWDVLSSIAMGEGRQRCGFDNDTAQAMWLPALDGMNKDEIYELNRVVTSNFRNAENGSSLDLRKLFPISRQAVTFLTDRNGKWSCGSISGIRDKSINYMKAKSLK